ncbi:MAG TPA: hypothetical protein VK718_09825 [Ferruginibacter sp.]|jgi:hypothetical protein|nr:hypothetical protein [Ferruginibacter sp.]
MKKSRFNIVWLLLACIGCNKSTSTGPKMVWNGNVVAFAPVAVSKSATKRVFAHILPWFETPLTNGGSWGEHWTGTAPNGQPLDNPNSGQIASHYYPSIRPYASSDTNVIDYQLMLMKLSGIDGVFIDWPGTVSNADLPKNLANSNVIISRLARAGLKFAVVYEDQNLKGLTNPIAQAQADMSYLQTNYFSNPNYEQISGSPLLLDFGPQTLTTASDWTSAFSGLSPKPAFFTLQNQSSEAGSNAVGEFTWVEQDTITQTKSFYSNGYSGIKIADAYPGYNSIYAEEQAGAGPTWVVTPSVSIFQKTLALALQQPGNYIQLVTWNDYGEGTMIEPTTQFQYNFLTILQQQLGVQSLSVSDLQAVQKLYTTRVNNILPNYNASNLAELDQVYYYMASLQMDSAKALLNNF